MQRNAMYFILLQYNSAQYCNVFYSAVVQSSAVKCILLYGNAKMFSEEQRCNVFL